MGGLAQRHQLHRAQPVPDLAAAVDWFVRVLGLAVDFLHGDAPHVHGRVKTGQLGPEGWGAPVYIHLARQVSPVAAGAEIRLHVGHDIDGLYQHALNAGAIVLRAPVDQPWGLREFVLQAPGGHVPVLGAEIRAEMTSR